MKAATIHSNSIRVLIAITILFAAMFTTTRIISAAPIDPVDGILSNVEFDREAGENGIFTADLSVQYTSGNYGEAKPIALEFTSEMTPSFDLIDGHSDVYVESVDGGEISQGNKYYHFWYLEYSPEKFATMLSIVGQKGDASFDNAWFSLANDCTVLVVVDDKNDPVSSAIYTRLACQLTQYQIDNAPEYLGDALLLITPLYTTHLPTVSR